jgi:hypothetical protein
VRVGEDINTVKRRLFPAFEKKVYDRHATLQLELNGVNLVLAIEKGGRVIGIGRNIPEKDDGEVWVCSTPIEFAIASLLDRRWGITKIHPS